MLVDPTMCESPLGGLEWPKVITVNCFSSHGVALPELNQGDVVLLHGLKVSLSSLYSNPLPKSMYSSKNQSSVNIKALGTKTGCGIASSTLPLASTRRRTFLFHLGPLHRSTIIRPLLKWIMVVHLLLGGLRGSSRWDDDKHS